MAENKFTRRELLGWMTGEPPNVLIKRDLTLPTIIQNKKSEEQAQDDGGVWLEGTGLSLYRPKDGQNLTASDVSQFRVPLKVTENVQLQNPTSLNKIVRPIIDRMYPSLSRYLDEDTKAEQELKANSQAKTIEGGGAQIFRNPVKIIYAMARPGDVNNSIAGLTRMRVSGNEVEYAIIIRLNPTGVQFNNQDEFRHWIQAVYVHEMTHVRQKDILWKKLLHESMLKWRLPTQGEIFSTLDNPAKIIVHESQAYWAGMSYAQIMQPNWFATDESPDFSGLKKPFLKLKKMGMDPLIDGEHTNHPIYDENALEAMWFNTVFFNIAYDGLVKWSKTDPKLVSAIELCNREGLIPNREFEEYLAQVGTFQAMIYLKQREMHHDPNFPSWSLAGTTLGIVGVGLGAALLFRMFGARRE